MATTFFSVSVTVTSLFLSFTMFFHQLHPLEAACGFSIDLIHRDSPRSPFYNSSETLSHRMARAFRRSISRIAHFHRSTKAVVSKVIPNGADYLMSFSLGTPPMQILAIADTGSDLIWTQCQPCDYCYKQKAPYFDPKKSSTYKKLPCTSTLCKAIPQASCNPRERCDYAYSYGDHSFTNGILATETFQMGSFKFPNVAFGCAHENGGAFTIYGSGMVGLGAGPLSLVSQLGSSIAGKFSYCLVPLSHKTSSSRMHFGDSSIVSGHGAVSTPLIIKQDDSFYYLTLKKITVGNKAILIPQQAQGNIIIDSGSFPTFLPSSVYKELVSVFRSSIKFTPAKDPSQTFELCYDAPANARVPYMKWEFEGAELVLGALNTFVRVSERVMCLAFMASDTLSMFGNVAQQNFRVGYDLLNKKVSFLRADCTKQKQ